MDDWKVSSENKQRNEMKSDSRNELKRNEMEIDR